MELELDFFSKILDIQKHGLNKKNSNKDNELDIQKVSNR